MSEELRKRRFQAIVFHTFILVLSIIVVIILTLLNLRLGEDTGEAPNLMPFQIFILIIAFYSAMEVWRYYKIRIPEMSLVEVLKCNKCGYVEKRRPQKGDFVFKKVGECPKCGGVIFIESIYKEVKARKSER